jgi:nucleoside-diphosphate-sugar epimerase
MSVVLIAGCGHLGTALGLLLAHEGHRVYGLRRDPSQLPAPLEPLAADLRGAAPLRLPPCDWLCYTAAPDGRTAEQYRAVYVEGLARTLDACAAAGPLPRRVLFTSSTAVYGQNDGSWVDEDSPTAPSGFPGRILLEAEGLLAQSGTTGLALRLGGLYGPGRTRLIESVLNGESDCAAGPPRYTNRIHRDDAALACAHLLEVEDPEPVYNVVDREPAAELEVLTWLAARLDVPPPRANAPGPAAAHGGLGSNKRVRSDRLQRSGYRFRYPTFREGYEALIAGLGESPWHRGARP